MPSCCLYLPACYVYSVVGWCHPAVCICLHVMCTVWWDGASWRLAVSFWRLYLHASYMCRCCAVCNTGMSVLKSLCPTRPLSCMKTVVTTCTCHSSSLLTSPVWQWLACGEWCCAHPHAPLHTHQTRPLAPRQTPGLARLLIHCHMAPHPGSCSCVEIGVVPMHPHSHLHASLALLQTPALARCLASPWCHWQDVLLAPGAIGEMSC